MKLSLLKKSIILITVLIFGIIISLVVLLPLILEEEPYFITIKNNEDLEFWSNSGNGTIENPFVIEGHSITVPENDPDDYDVPCIPENSVISITNITKSFIIQNNIIKVKGGCEEQSIIRISDISVPFAICNNYFRGGYYAEAFSLSNIDGRGSVISNNDIHEASSILTNVHNVSFIKNQFYTIGHSPNMYAYQSSNITLIQNYFSLYGVSIRECSHMLLHDNFHENDERYSGWDLLHIRETGYCTITNNTFVRGGLDLRVFASYYPTAIISGNIVNGRPYGYFYNQSIVSINASKKYGQIRLVMCNFTTITDQVISDLSQALIIMNCTDSTITNSNFSYCRTTGIKIYNSNHTSIVNCKFESRYIGVRGENSHGVYVKECLFKNLYRGIELQACTIFLEEDNIFEDVDYDVVIW